MAESIYQHLDYRKFLAIPLSERGSRKKLAAFIPCQTTFLSNVMNGHANLSLEHAIRVAEFLNLNERESHYFMQLVHLSKAGSKTLEAYYRKQIETLQAEQNQITHQISKHQTLSIHEQVTFYNSWLYAAIHILVAVPEYQNRAKLRAFLQLPAKELDPIIDFLIQYRILEEYEGILTQGTARIHLPKGSPFLPKHHINWRMKAIQSLDHEKEQDLHYTIVMSLSKKDIDRIKSILLESIQKTDQLLRETGDETVFGLCIDWFQL